MTLNISWKVRSTWTQASKNTFWCLLGCSIGDFGTLSRQMALNLAFKTAIGMSLISMISMEVTMNVTDVLLTGGAKLTWWVIPIMLIVGFLTPLPYNYWRLQALNKSCH